MNPEKEKMVKAGELLGKIADGVNPLDGETIVQESFLQDPRIVRCLIYAKDMLMKLAERGYRTDPQPAAFSITAEEKSRIELPSGKIGINKFAQCINQVIDITRSRKITGVELNRRLKKLGVLSDQTAENGKSHTTVNEKSKDYGIELERRKFQGNEYDMILFSEKGKKYLLDNLETILKEEDAS